MNIRDRYDREPVLRHIVDSTSITTAAQAASEPRGDQMRRGHHRLHVPPDTLDKQTMKQAIDVVHVVRLADGSQLRTPTPKQNAKRSHYYSALMRCR